jgi:hypothetical protein
MSDAIKILEDAKHHMDAHHYYDCRIAIDAAIAALQSGEAVALERVEAHLEIEYDEVKIVIEPDPEGSLVYYDNVVRAMQATPQPVVPPQWRVVMRGMIEYAECNDPGNPYLDQAKALLSAGKGE